MFVGFPEMIAICLILIGYFELNWRENSKALGSFILCEKNRKYYVTNLSTIQAFVYQISHFQWVHLNKKWPSQSFDFLKWEDMEQIKQSQLTNPATVYLINYFETNLASFNCELVIWDEDKGKSCFAIIVVHIIVCSHGILALILPFA